MDKDPQWCLTTTVGRGERWAATALRALLDRIRRRRTLRSTVDGDR